MFNLKDIGITMIEELKNDLIKFKEELLKNQGNASEARIDDLANKIAEDAILHVQSEYKSFIVEHVNKIINACVSIQENASQDKVLLDKVFDEIEDMSKQSLKSTNQILDACDALSKDINKREGSSDEKNQESLKHIDAIIAACDVHDLNTQRIKILKSLLEDIKFSVISIAKKVLYNREQKQGKKIKEGDELLMTGPQSDIHALSQDDIDKLLNG
jgi:chemotaxis regulatin CheY-phosphate phosphatase CheZ